jgi:ABC-type Fe2+-enterobactin transport system substrate-binding protein
VTYLDDFQEGDEAEVEQSVDDLLALVTAFMNKVKEKPDVIDKISYNAKSFQYSIWKDYFNSGEILENLEAVSKALTYYKDAGETNVFFWVG